MERQTKSTQICEMAHAVYETVFGAYHFNDGDYPGEFCVIFVSRNVVERNHGPGGGESGAQAEAQKLLKGVGLTAQIQGDGDVVTGQIPAAGQSVPGDSQVLLYFGEVPEERYTAVPDFTGMNRQQASDAAGGVGLYILVAGNSSTQPNVTVTAQSVPKDTQVPVGTTIRLEFADTHAAD